MTGPEAFVKRLVTAVNGHDVEALVDCFAEDYVNTTPVHPARGFVGREQVRRNWSSIFGGVPDLTARVTATAVDGDDVWSEWEMEGHRRDGLKHQMRGIVVFTTRDGRASAARFFLEPLDTGDADIRAVISTQLGQP